MSTLEEVASAAVETPVAPPPSLGDLCTRAERRRRTARRRRVAGATAAGLVMLVCVTVVAGGRSTDVRVTVDGPAGVGGPGTTATDSAENVPPATSGAIVPDLIGMTLIEAQELATSRGFKAVTTTSEDGQRPSDPDFPFAVVLAQEPGADQPLPPVEVPSAYFNVIGLRTVLPSPPDENICPGSDHRPDSTSEGLPWEGSTTRAAVDEFMQTLTPEEASGALRQPITGMWPGTRNGLVWRQPTDEIVDATPDYWIIAQVPDVTDCPDSGPPSLTGMPIEFTHDWPVTADR